MLTASEIFEEYVKCVDNPSYAIETYLKTFDKTQEGFVPFKLFVRQRQIVKSYEANRFNLITKPRQAGISTVTQGYLSIKLGFADPNNPETIVCIANKLTLAKKFLKGIKDYTNQLPRWVWGSEYYGSEEKEKKTIFIKDSQIEVELPNGSKIIAVATSEDALRGYTPTYLIFDEAAFIDNGANLYAAAVTSLGCLTKDSLILTDNGLVELDELVKEKTKIGFTDLNEPYKVCDRHGNIVDATQTFVSEYGETYKIKTNLGVELEGSWKHPLLVKRNNQDEWVRMNQLNVGDELIIQYNQNIFGDNEHEISESDYSYPSNDLLKAKKDIILKYIQDLFNGKDYIQNDNYEGLKRIQSLLFNVGIISEINGDILRALKRNEESNGFITTSIVDISKSENHTYDLHVPSTNSFISNGIISHNTGGKCTLISCVTKETFVFTDEGVKQMDEFIDKDKSGGYNVPHYNVMGLNKHRQSNIFFNNGTHDTIKIKSLSSELEGTHTHKVWAYSFKHCRYDWFTMSELEIGDYINVQYGFELWGNNNKLNCEYEFKTRDIRPHIKYDKIDEELAYLIGLHISDNSLFHKTFYKMSHDYFNTILESLGFDLKTKKKDKYIPSRLMQMSRDNMIAMMQGMMDGNAFVDSKTGKIKFRTHSEKLAKQVRALLLNFGILTEYKAKDIYQVTTTHSNTKKYYDLIGFRFDSKNNKEFQEKKLNETQSFIPDGKKIIRDILNENSLVRKIRYNNLKASDVKINKINKTDDLSKTKFIDFIDYFTNELKLDLSKYNIDKILFNNSKWEKIDSIQHLINETYDFSLPNDETDFWCHSVLYNGVLGHQTPNGYDALYYKTYEQAIRKENKYNIIELKWYEDPRYNKDLRWIKNEDVINETEFTLTSFKKMVNAGYKPASTWYDDMCKNMNQDKKKIAQELDVSFLGSGGNVIDDEFIDMHEKTNVMEPKFVDKTYYDGNSGLIWIWSEPLPNHEYCIIGDVSRGDGTDYSVFQIIDFTTMEQVAEYQGKIPPDIFAHILNDYGKKYDAYMVVDNIGVGHTTISKLEELKYPNLHYEEKTKGNKTAGFNINGVRLQLISHFEEMVRTNSIKIRSIRVIHEMKTFIFKNGRPDHMEGYNDDLIMSLGMGLWILESSFKSLKKTNNQTKALLSAWTTGSNDTSMASTIEYFDQNKNKKITKANPSHVAYKNIQDPNGDFLWLFSGLK